MMRTRTNRRTARPTQGSHLTHRLALVAILILAAVCGSRGVHAQENPAAVDHAKRLFDLMERGQFDDVAKEFNEKVAAAMTAAKLRQIWETLHQQAGPFKGFIGQQVQTPRADLTAVALGCQFEKLAMNVVFAFDAENKLAGLHFVPRAAPADQTSSAPPASSRFKEEPVTIGTGDLALPGTLSMPIGPIAAAVILVHGSGPHDRDETIGPNKPFRDLAWGLADRGVAVLRYEKATKQHPATFVGKNFTVREETIDDALRAVALLRTHDRIDPKHVFVLGHSLGATLAPRIAAEDKSLGGIIIMAGTTRPFDQVVRDQLTYLKSLNPDKASGLDIEATIQKLRQVAPESYWKDFEAYNPTQTAAALSIPILVLQGERDYQVSAAADLKGWRDALAGHPNVTIKSYPTLNHLFQPGEGKSTPEEYQRAGHIPDFVLDDIANWIKKSSGTPSATTVGH